MSPAPGSRGGTAKARLKVKLSEGVSDTKRALAASVVLLVALATSCARLGSPHAVAPTPIVLFSSETDLDTFTPAPDAVAKVTSSEALDAFLTKNPGWQYRRDQPTNVQLGYLASYRA